MTLPYTLLAKKRAGLPLADAEIAEIVQGAVDGSWSDAQLAAFLMAAAIRELGPQETAALTRGMLDSGERWDLAREVPNLCDKHSTGGVGDKVSLVLGPLLAACGLPTAMLVGRGLGHTGGTADKLDAVPGLTLELDRRRCLDLLARTGLAIGVATTGIAPADKKLYALRDQTATIDSIPLIVASILSKKLAVGPAAVAFDVKTGDGAFLPERDRAEALARRLVETLASLGTAASAWVTDMSQPLGRWVGHAAEVAESLESLEGGGPDDLREVTLALAVEAARLVKSTVTRTDFEGALRDGRARAAFNRWAEAQGADPRWLEAPELALASHVEVVSAPTSGWLAHVRNRDLGLLLIEAGGGRAHAGAKIDLGVAFRVEARIGDAIQAGQELLRLYLREPNPKLARRFQACFEIREEPAEAPPLLVSRITG